MIIDLSDIGLDPDGIKFSIVDKVWCDTDFELFDFKGVLHWWIHRTGLGEYEILVEWSMLIMRNHILACCFCICVRILSGHCWCSCLNDIVHAPNSVLVGGIIVCADLCYWFFGQRENWKSKNRISGYVWNIGSLVLRWTLKWGYSFSSLVVLVIISEINYTFFQAIIRDPFMLNSVILVFANKQDLVCWFSDAICFICTCLHACIPKMCHNSHAKFHLGALYLCLGQNVSTQFLCALMGNAARTRNWWL